MEHKKLSAFIDPVNKSNKANFDEMARLERQNSRMLDAIEQNKGRIEELRRSHTYPSAILESIARVIAQRLNLKWSVSGPCGIFNEYLLAFSDEKCKYRLIVYCDTDSSGNFAFRYATGETLRRFAPGTIGALNGGNNVTLRLPETLEELIDIILASKRP